MDISQWRFLLPECLTLWDNPDDLVFTDETGKHYAIHTFYKKLKQIAASIDRPDARPHDLRHEEL